MNQTTKPNECKGCLLSGQSLSGYYTSDKVDVLFLGHCPTRLDVKVGKHFTGFRGFLHLVKSLHSCGITDCWKCPQEDLPDVHWNGLHPHCLELLQEEIYCHSPKVVVPVGGLALQVLQNYWDFNGSKLGKVEEFRVIPILHPSNPEAKKSILKGFELLREVLNEQAS